MGKHMRIKTAPKGNRAPSSATGRRQGGSPIWKRAATSSQRMLGSVGSSSLPSMTPGSWSSPQWRCSSPPSSTFSL